MKHCNPSVKNLSTQNAKNVKVEFSAHHPIGTLFQQVHEVKRCFSTLQEKVFSCHRHFEKERTMTLLLSAAWPTSSLICKLELFGDTEHGYIMWTLPAMKYISFVSTSFLQLRWNWLSCLAMAMPCACS